MSAEQSTIERIVKVVNWYHKIPADFNDVELLTNASRKLACLLFDYSGEVGDMYKLAKGTEYARKVAYEKERLSLIGKGKSAAAAEIEARAGIDQQMFAETCADSDFRSAQMQLSAARDVLEAIRQHIASLKMEQRLEMQGQGSQR